MKGYVFGQKRVLPQEFAEFFDPRHTAIISIDMHEGHLADDPDCPCPAPRGREIVAPIDQFHEQARALSVPVIHVKTTLRRSGVDDVKGIPAAWRLTLPLHIGPIPNVNEHAIEGTRWTKLATHVAPDDHIVDGKRRLSVFYPTDLDFLLRQLGTRVVVLNGGMTDCCVLNAAFDASNLNYRVIVVKDLVRGSNPAMEDAALEIASLHLGVVTDAEDLVHTWRHAGETAFSDRERQ